MMQLLICRHVRNININLLHHACRQRFFTTIIVKRYPNTIIKSSLSLSYYSIIHNKNDNKKYPRCYNNSNGSNYHDQLRGNTNNIINNNNNKNYDNIIMKENNNDNKDNHNNNNNNNPIDTTKTLNDTTTNTHMIDRTKSNQNQQQQHNRILVVKRKQQNKNQQQNQQQKQNEQQSLNDNIMPSNQSTSYYNTNNFGYYQKKKYYPIDDIIRDPFGHIIYIPGRHMMSSNNIIPIIDMSALLNVSKYCKVLSTKNTITSKSGADAAKRYIRGKKFILDVLKHHIHYYYKNMNINNKNNVKITTTPSSSSSSSSQPTNNDVNSNNSMSLLLQNYILTGHGIPSQVLQNHIDMADNILKYHDDSYSCQFQIDSIHHRHVMNHVYDEPWNMIITNNNRDESSTRITVLWPFNNNNDENNNNNAEMIQYDMELYLTVMNRITSQLNPILIQPNTYRFYNHPSSSSLHHQKMTSIATTTTTTTTTTNNTSSLSSLSVSIWNVNFCRDSQLSSSSSFQSSSSSSPIMANHHHYFEINPIVEWIPNYAVSSTNETAADDDDSTSMTRTKKHDNDNNNNNNNNNENNENNKQYWKEGVKNSTTPSPPPPAGGHVTIRLQGYPSSAYHQLWQNDDSEQHQNDNGHHFRSVDETHRLLSKYGITLSFDAYYEPRIEK